MKALLLLLLAMPPLFADTLTLADAVAIGLEHNFSIRLRRIEEAQSANNKRLITGALLPTARLDASGSTTGTDYFSSMPRGAVTSSDELRAGAVLSWTLFDGFRMFHAGRQITLKAALAETATRHEIETTSSAIITAYYNLVSQRALKDAAREQLTLSQSRLAFVTSQYEFGRVGRRELLTQQVMVNSDSSALLALQLHEQKALHSFNLALGRVPDTPCICSADSSVLTPIQTAAWWYNEALQHNAGLQMNIIRKNIAVTQHAIAEAAYWPVVSASGSVYGISQNQSEFMRSQAALTVTLPIFSGFTKTTAVKNSALDTTAATLTLKSSQQELQALIYEQFDLFSTSAVQADFEKQAIHHSRELLTLAEEQYRMGRISETTLREAQVALLQTQVRYQSALFQNRIVAVQLEMLAGKLSVQ